MMETTDLRDAIDLVLDDRLGVLHTSFPAKVLAYDPTKQTVDIRPAIKREVNTEDGGVTFDTMPDLYNIQIMWPCAGGFAITFPISVGDWVLVTCAEQSTMVWRRNGNVPASPGYTDPHGLNGCVAQVGWRPENARVPSVNTSRLELRSLDGRTKVAIDNGTVVLGSDTGAQPVALSPLVEAAIEAAVLGHVHGNVVTSTDPAAVSGAGVLSAPVLNTASTMVKAA